MNFELISRALSVLTEVIVMLYTLLGPVNRPKKVIVFTLGTLLAGIIAFAPEFISPPLITTTINNSHCMAQDYYVDGVRVTSIPANSTASFQTSPGQHTTYICLPGTNTCTIPLRKIWMSTASDTITAGSTCPITIAITNTYCKAQDYYVDGVRVTSIPANSTASFQTTPGQHMTYICLPGTNTCTTPLQKTWTSTFTDTITSSDTCPITITVANNYCKAQDYYVDGVRVISIPANSTASFQTSPGAHMTYICLPGSGTCTTPLQKDWTSTFTDTINTGTTCP